MLGYYHRPDLTAEALDDEGFLHTGRRGRVRRGRNGVTLPAHHRPQEGNLQDQRRQVHRAAARREQAQGIAVIAQAMVVGEYRKFPGALIVPNFAVVRERLARAPTGRRGAAARIRRRARRAASVRALIRGELEQTNADFAQYARIKNFSVLGRGMDDGRRRIDPDAEAQAPRDREEVRRRDREHLRRRREVAGHATFTGSGSLIR